MVYNVDIQNGPHLLAKLLVCSKELLAEQKCTIFWLVGCCYCEALAVNVMLMCLLRLHLRTNHRILQKGKKKGFAITCDQM